MGWLDKWFGLGGPDLPKDPGLDLFRDAVWRLSLDGQTRSAANSRWVGSGLPDSAFRVFLS
ncbi:hypothetical protein GCM10009670_23280 [Citricoccus alkalitolerans]